MSSPPKSNPGSNDDNVFQTRFSSEESESITYGVIDAIATLRNTSPTDIDLVLHDVVDPDLLDALRQHGQDPDGTSWEIEFTIEHYEVSIQSDGDITV